MYSHIDFAHYQDPKKAGAIYPYLIHPLWGPLLGMGCAAHPKPRGFLAAILFGLHYGDPEKEWVMEPS